MRQYFLGPIKWCLQEDQRGLNQAGQAPVTSTPHTDLPHAPTTQESLGFTGNATVLWPYCCQNCSKSAKTKTPFLLQPEHKANAEVQVLGWLPHVPVQTRPSQPCFCHRHEEKGAQRIIWEWAGEITGTFKAGMTCTAMQAQEFIL